MSTGTQAPRTRNNLFIFILLALSAFIVSQYPNTTGSFFMSNTLCTQTSANLPGMSFMVLKRTPWSTTCVQASDECRHTTTVENTEAPLSPNPSLRSAICREQGLGKITGIGGDDMSSMKRGHIGWTQEPCPTDHTCRTTPVKLTPQLYTYIQDTCDNFCVTNSYADSLYSACYAQQSDSSWKLQGTKNTYTLQGIIPPAGYCFTPTPPQPQEEQTPPPEQQPIRIPFV